VIATTSVEVRTQGNAHILDITQSVADEVQESGISSGIVTIFCPGATGAVTTIEFEEGAVRDFRRLFDEIAAPDRAYSHNALAGDRNGHSHVRAALLGPSLTVPFVEGQLILGTWQEIIFVDFDNRPHQRSIVLQIMGE
jgi:secondary thiamine-phosphate synthase enzyme